MKDLEEIKKEVKKIFDGKTSVGILCGIAIAIIAILIFSAGVGVGFHKASYGRAWGEHYDDNFGMGRPDLRFMGIGMINNFPNAHGAVGKIIKIELPNIIVEDKGNIEKVVLIKSDTKIQKVSALIADTDLALDNFVVVIGSPDTDGAIEAKLIRVIPSPETLQPEMQ